MTSLIFDLFFFSSLKVNGLPNTWGNKKKNCVLATFPSLYFLHGLKGKKQTLVPDMDSSQLHDTLIWSLLVLHSPSLICEIQLNTKLVVAETMRSHVRGQIFETIFPQ